MNPLVLLYYQKRIPLFVSSMKNLYLYVCMFACSSALSTREGLLTNWVPLSCLYAKFRWLISHVQLSFQPLSVNVLRRLKDSRGDMAVLVRRQRVNEAGVRPISQRSVILE